MFPLRGRERLCLNDTGFDLNELNDDDIKWNFLTFCHCILHLLDLRHVYCRMLHCCLRALNTAEGELKQLDFQVVQNCQKSRRGNKTKQRVNQGHISYSLVLQYRKGCHNDLSDIEPQVVMPLTIHLWYSGQHIHSLRMLILSCSMVLHNYYALFTLGV